MTQISDAKKRYDEIPIPEELSDVVRSAIDYSAVRKKKIRKRQNFRIGREYWQLQQRWPLCLQWD